ncbi:TRAP transporter small permease subunit [Sedimenticola selenatireducens]|mgnify:CR=1 FL=1|uniref:TRAP transporter small permease subunit n=1 Tax=Sedimenticola selenatireducens TaxID=191960 RepID=UPI0009FDD58B|nr:TRAP transporter small permease [Sedimenticola selenatireducens]
MADKSPKPVRSKFARVLRSFNRSVALLSGIALFIMMLIGAADAIGTSLFSTPLPAAFEATEALMVTSVFLALGLSQQRGAHISVEVLIGLTPSIAQRIAAAFGSLLSLVLFGLIAWFGSEAAIESFTVNEFSSGIVNFPIWPAKAALAFGATLMTVQCGWDFVNELMGRHHTTSQPKI